jgi:hypothetical protein
MLIDFYTNYAFGAVKNVICIGTQFSLPRRFLDSTNKSTVNSANKYSARFHGR